MNFYNDGYWGKCAGCGGDGNWMVDPDSQEVIICECGHEVISKWV